MNRRESLAALVTLAASSSTVLATQEGISAARIASAAWLSSLDLKDYERSWRGTASAFRRNVSFQDWQDALAAMRQPLGPMQKRHERSMTTGQNMQGGPDGPYVLVQYNTAFEMNPSAIEAVTIVQESDGQFRIAWYVVT